MFKCQAIRNIKLRYEAVGADVTADISNQHVADAIGVIATTTTTGVCIAEAFKIKSLKLWGPVNGATQASKLKIEWTGSSNNVYVPGTSVIAEGMGAGKLPFLHARPPRDSSAKMWHKSSSDTLFRIEAFQGAILELDVDFVLNDATTAISSATLTSATAGNFYHKGLGSVLDVVGLNSIS